jgi:dTDP-glucose 4,6-dehydratase
MRLLVTGGAGFIGSNFVRKCFDGSFPSIKTVSVLDKLTYAGNMANLESVRGKIEFTQGDICDRELFLKLLYDCDAIVNFAAESHVDRSIESANDFIETNIKGVQNMLDVIRTESPKKRFLQVSTDEVYGSINEGSWDENCSMLPNSPYAATKASAELLIRAYFKTYNMNVVVTRCSNNYGPYHYPEKLIPLFITNIIEERKVPLYGTGKNVRDWLHVEDHAEAIVEIAQRGTNGETYCIGGNCELTNLELINNLITLYDEMNETKSENLIQFVKDRPGHDLRYSIDYSKLQKDLGWSPKRSIFEGLRQTILWYSQIEYID